MAIRELDGKVHIKQSISLVGRAASHGTISGAFWGARIGLLFLPLSWQG